LRQIAFYEAIEFRPPVLPPMLNRQDRDPEVLHNLFGLVDGYGIALLSPVLDRGL
jgi:hypothetical protein